MVRSTFAFRDSPLMMCQPGCNFIIVMFWTTNKLILSCGWHYSILFCHKILNAIYLVMEIWSSMKIVDHNKLNLRASVIKI